MESKDLLDFEHKPLELIKLYVESFLIENEKGFPTHEQRNKKLQALRISVFRVIEEESQKLGISTEEVVENFQNQINNEKMSMQINEKYNKEYYYIDTILSELAGFDLPKEKIDNAENER